MCSMCQGARERLAKLSQLYLFWMKVCLKMGTPNFDCEPILECQFQIGSSWAEVVPFCHSQLSPWDFPWNAMNDVNDIWYVCHQLFFLEVHDPGGLNCPTFRKLFDQAFGHWKITVLVKSLLWTDLKRLTITRQRWLIGWFGQCPV